MEGKTGEGGPGVVPSGGRDGRALNVRKLPDWKTKLTKAEKPPEKDLYLWKPFRSTVWKLTDFPENKGT